MSNDSCGNGHNHSCSCQLATPSVSQTLDELDFTRGIWTAALDGCEADLLSCLEKRNVHPDAKDSSGYSSLHYAARNGHLKICQILLDKGASPNIQTNSGQVTPLHRAAYCGHRDIVELLISQGGNVNMVDADGKLPLHKAAERGHSDVVEILLKSDRAGKSVLDNRGRKPVDCVPANCDRVKELLQTKETKDNQSIQDDDT